MKRYIVTEKQLQLLKDKLDASYRPIPKEELREWLEDIEAQEEPGRAALEIIAGRMAGYISAYRNSSIYDLRPFNLFGEDIAVAGIFQPHLQYANCFELWNKAVKAEREKEGGAYDILIKALEGKPC